MSSCLRDFHVDFGDVNIIALDPVEMMEVNKKWLNHNYPTDVIAFSYTGAKLNADVYVCPEVIRMNGDDHSESFERELHRCVVHGFLHLSGFDDALDDDRENMRRTENLYLQRLDELFHVKQS